MWAYGHIPSMSAYADTGSPVPPQPRRYEYSGCMDRDIPWCDVCESREAVSLEGGVYRCEPCETRHLSLAARDPRDADPETEEAA